MGGKCVTIGTYTTTEILEIMISTSAAVRRIPTSTPMLLAAEVIVEAGAVAGVPGAAAWAGVEEEVVGCADPHHCNDQPNERFFDIAKGKFHSKHLYYTNMTKGLLYFCPAVATETVVNETGCITSAPEFTP